MLHLVATLHTLGIRATDQFNSQKRVLDRARSERGSVTIEQVLWAAAVILIVSIVSGAIIAFVRSKSQDIQSP